MASSPLRTQSVPNNKDGNNEDGCSSYFLKTVCLQDWWLIKADKDFEGKRLAVAGLTSRGQQQVRVFYSAPITRRFDIFTLETADGIFVMIQGLLNKLRTVENGFSSEASSHFLFGFPTYWEEYAKKYFREEPSKGIGFRNISTAEKATTKPARFSRSVEEVRVSVDSKLSDGNLEGTEQPTGSENRSRDKEKEDDRNATDRTMSVRMMQSRIDENNDNPNAEEMDALNVTPPSNYGGKRSSIELNYSGKKQKENPVSTCSMNDKENNFCGVHRSNNAGVCLGATCGSMSRSPYVRDFNIPEFSENQSFNTTMAVPMVRSTIDLNSNSPTAVDMDAENVIPVSNSGGRRSSIRVKYLRRKQKENPASRHSSNYKDMDFSGFNSSYEAGVCLRLGLTHGSVSRFPVVGDFNIPELSGNQIDSTATMAVSMVQSRIDATSSAVEMDAVNFTPMNSDGKRRVIKGNYLRRKQREIPVSRCSMKDKDKMYIREEVELPDDERPKGNSSQSAVRSRVSKGKLGTPNSKGKLGTLNSKGKLESLGTPKGKGKLGTPNSNGRKQHSSANKSKRKIVFDSHTAVAKKIIELE